MSALVPARLQGDGPCMDCGTEDNIRWFTDSTFWNEVLGGPGAMDDPGGILCIACFVIRVDAAGFAPIGWRLTPEWRWELWTEEPEPAPDPDPGPSARPPRHLAA